VFALPAPPFERGYIALIVIVVLLVLALLIAALVWLVRRMQKQKRAAAALAANAEPRYWSADDEANELHAVGKQHQVEGKLLVSTLEAEQRSLYEVLRDDSVPLFGVARGTRCAVNEELQDKMVLVNHSNQRVNYTITVPTSGDECGYDLTAKPGVGTLAAGERRDVTLLFTLNFTTKVYRWVKVEFEGAEGAIYIALNVEGAVSTRIDPMELELYGKPIGEGAFGVVYRGKYRGTLVAAKVPRKQGEMKDSQLRSFQDEIALFEKLRSPYIVNFIGASHVPGRLCICTELLERGTVFELIHKAKVSGGAQGQDADRRRQRARLPAQERRALPRPQARQPARRVGVAHRRRQLPPVRLWHGDVGRRPDPADQAHRLGRHAGLHGARADGEPAVQLQGRRLLARHALVGDLCRDGAVLVPQARVGSAAPRARRHAPGAARRLARRECAR
jgi:hypothetical protein